MKFKIGDKVRVVNKQCESRRNINVGDVGTIIEIKEDYFCAIYNEKWDGHQADNQDNLHNWWFFDDDLELVEKEQQTPVKSLIEPKITINGLIYEIIIVDKFDNNCNAQCDNIKFEIKFLKDIVKSQNLDRAIVHELVHAMMYAYNQFNEEDKYSEEFIAMFVEAHITEMWNLVNEIYRILEEIGNGFNS